MGWTKITRPTWKESSKFIKRSNIYLGSYLINKMGICDLNYIQVLQFGWDEKKKKQHDQYNHKKIILLTTK